MRSLRRALENGSGGRSAGAPEADAISHIISSSSISKRQDGVHWGSDGFEFLGVGSEWKNGVRRMDSPSFEWYRCSGVED